MINTLDNGQIGCLDSDEHECSWWWTTADKEVGRAFQSDVLT